MDHIATFEVSAGIDAADELAAQDVADSMSADLRKAGWVGVSQTGDVYPAREAVIKLTRR
jgi:hypothetical protein